MIPRECKRLAEVDFPIAVVSRHSAREKSIRHGHPSTLHLWWARRPLAACRAMLMALLLPDPADPKCPPGFKDGARKALKAFPAITPARTKKMTTDQGLREVLLEFIGDFSNWDVAADEHYLRAARALVKAAHGDEKPLVVDPFAGGGSIPLEALRIGCDAFASDLNPVACLILKTMLEDIPRHGPGLADELRRAGKQIKETAEKELREFYPADPDGSTPIAYLWARTVRCEAVGCGAEIPLVRSWWLSKKPSRRRALRPKVRKGKPPSIDFEIFTPKSDKDVPAGTVTRAKATCLACRTVLQPERVRAQLAAQRGGADVQFDSKGLRMGGARLLAVVSLHPDRDGRQYRVAIESDYRAARKAQKRLFELEKEKLPNGLSLLPSEPTPAGGGSGAGRAFSIQKYGMMQFGDLFTARQKLGLAVLADAVRDTKGPDTQRLAAVALDRVASRSSALCLWRYHADQEKVEHIFGRQALPIVWDFAEAVVTSQSTGSFADGVEVVAGAVGSNATTCLTPATTAQADARDVGLPTAAAQILFTDPPYYDAIPYSDLSDFFLVWLKRTIVANGARFFFEEGLSPKRAEIVQDETREHEGHAKDRAFFESAMFASFLEARRHLDEHGIGCVVFAHKTTEGWETLLTGMVRGGWTITGSWPLTTEMPNRLRARESAALAASVHLVMRPRPIDAMVGDWSDVARDLPKRVGDWMERLTKEGVRGADLVFACIGPAMEVYSRYSKVEDAAGREIPLGGDPEAREPHKRGFLAYVWEMVGRAALNQVLGTGEARPADGAIALEEDARLTALFLWTLQSTAGAGAKGDRKARDDADDDEDDADEGAAGRAPRRRGLTLVYDVVRRFAQPLGIHLDDWTGRIVEIEKGVVRLLPVSDRAEQIFGSEGAGAVATRIEAGVRAGRQIAFDFLLDGGMDPPREKKKGPKAKRGAAIRDEELAAHREATTLDRVHAAMLLQAAGRATALRTFLSAEQDRGPEFLRLANALSALYPRESEEKRLLDAMLLAIPQ